MVGHVRSALQGQLNMTVTPVKVILFLLGGTAAAGATAYVAGVFDPLFDRRPAIADATSPAVPDQKLAELPPSAGTPGPLDSGSAADASAPAGQSAGTDATGDASPAAVEQSAEGEAAQDVAALSPEASAARPDAPPPVIAPTFDLVRVEPDGSIVIAGHAAPNANVEAVIGSRVIGTAAAGPDGAFAIVLDDALKPGDYQIVLRSRTADNVVATSIETAVVSVPETLDGQVLALVEEPGKPAELITVPKPEGTPAADASPADGGQGEAAQQPPSQPTPAQDAPASTGTAQQEDPADAAPATGTVSAESTGPAAPDDGQGASGETVAQSQPTAPQAAGVEPSTAGTEEKTAPASRLAVEAVEIEGRRIFIAGAADPGRIVRAYANEDFLGEARTSAMGRFLVEAERDLPVGDYIIRVDALEPNGSKVVARAAVPFEREAGENIAAIAPPAGQAVPDAPRLEDAAPKGDRLATEAEARAEPEAPHESLEESGQEPEADIAMSPAAEKEQPAQDPAVAGTNPPAADAPAESAAPPSVAVAAPVTTAETGEPPRASVEAASEAEENAAPGPAETDAAPTPGRVEPVNPAANAAAAQAQAEAAPPANAGTEAVLAGKEPEAARPATAAGTAPAVPDVAVAAAPATVPPTASAEAPAADAAPLAPKLQNVDSAVIIRRGDTLWRISRRVYGRGIRYSTIYLANQDQIQNPDHILPGQVFKVPDQTEEGEPADLTRMGEQAVDTPVRQ